MNRTLRVAVDATPLLGPRTGVGVFTEALVQGLAHRDEIDLAPFSLTWRGRHRLAGVCPSEVQPILRPAPARPLRFVWSRIDWPPIEWWTGHCDVLHGTNFVVPPSRRGGQVVTVHDLTTVHHPELCSRDTLIYPEMLRRAIHRGAVVHAVSEFVADEVREHFSVPPDRVVTVLNGVRSAGASVRPRSDAHHVPSEPYLLALGTVEPRKDLVGLVTAFEAMAGDHPNLQLVVAGPDGWGSDELDLRITSSSQAHRIHRLRRYVSEQERVDLIAHAELLVYPSIYEGFGLPPLEALDLGTAVVATRAGALPEILGDAAVLVEVGDPDALAEAVGRLLVDEDRQIELIEKGSARVRELTWSRCVDGLVDLYQRTS